MQSGLSAKFEDAANLISKVWTSEFSMMLSAKFGRWCCGDSIPTTQAQENVRLFKIRSRIGEDLLLPVRSSDEKIDDPVKGSSRECFSFCFQEVMRAYHSLLLKEKKRRSNCFFFGYFEGIQVCCEMEEGCRRGSNKLFLLLIFYFRRLDGWIEWILVVNCSLFWFILALLPHFSCPLFCS